MIETILLVFAFVLAVLAAGSVPTWPRLNLGWAAFACFIAAILFGHLAPMVH